MINLNLRRENPQDNVNRILAIESIIKYYPIDIVEELEPRAILAWTEIEEDQEVPMKQIDIAFLMFGLPTPELRHLMTKLIERVKKDEIPPRPEETGIEVDTLSDDEKAERLRIIQQGEADKGAVVRQMIMKP